ncbi:hypothetical protein J2847_002941 [Azospirillum agricola]|uniref:hypothetical protein n=1 Tax=Azospirillum agricola TaxID=1720247 RepID=UPI001AE23C1D|nr:hypothetical protein [Azospirillum agricola]MBP2229642.1 hypothetical protein [Azospirillum agricola]
MSASSITDLRAEWEAAQADFNRLWAAADQRYGEVADSIPLPGIVYGRRGWCITSEREIDDAWRLSSATKTRLKARLQRQLDQRDKALDAAGLTELVDQRDAAAKAMDRAAAAMAADRSGTAVSLHAKLSVVKQMMAEGSDLSGVDRDVLLSACADADAMLATHQELLRLSALMGFGPGASAGPSADEVALLLSLERQHHALDQEYEAIPDSEPDAVWQPVYQRLSDLEVRIADTPITTMAGALVKLRLARGPVGTGDGEVPTHCMESACATLEAVAVSAGYVPPWPGRSTVAAGGAA